MSDKQIEFCLRRMFRQAGLAAALSELKTCREFPQYLDGIVQNLRCPPDIAKLIWAMQRGNQWETI